MEDHLVRDMVAADLLAIGISNLVSILPDTESEL